MAALFGFLVKFIIGATIFVGLPIIGWGGDDIRGFGSDPARCSYLLATVLLQIVTLTFMPAGGGSRGKGIKMVHRHRLSLVLLQMIGLILVLAAPYCDRRNLLVIGNSEMIRIFGLGLYLGGFFIMQWAVLSLGKQFSIDVTVQEDHRLVTSGPYRLLRHPRYFGILIYFAGLSLIFRSGAGLLLTMLLIPIFVWRIHDEEALMYQEFGEEWERYRRRSYRLFPYIY